MSWGKEERGKCIEIPLRGSNEVVEVFLDDLPLDPSEIKGIIVSEAAPIDLFLHFAVSYFQHAYPSSLFIYRLIVGILLSAKIRRVQILVERGFD